jgi:hypothetical protein
MTTLADWYRANPHLAAMEINRLKEMCATTAERVCREHADPKAGHAAAAAIRALTLSSQDRGTDA